MAKRYLLIVLIIGLLLVIGYFTFNKPAEEDNGNGNGKPLINQQLPNQDSNGQDEFIGEKGKKVFLLNQQIILKAETFADNLVHYYNTELPDGKAIYFFALRDKNGIYRAAANACQVCFDARMGFSQQGDYMVCNTCGNQYPLEKIATEKGGCNPGPINPNLKVEDGKVIINQSDLEQVADLF